MILNEKLYVYFGYVITEQTSIYSLLHARACTRAQQVILVLYPLFHCVCLLLWQIMDTSLVYDSINVSKKADVLWPNDDWRAAGGKSGWKEWAPRKGMEGTVVHRWTPGNSDPTKCSHTDKAIVLVQLRDHFVPIAENGVLDLGAEV